MPYSAYQRPYNNNEANFLAASGIKICNNCQQYCRICIYILRILSSKNGLPFSGSSLSLIYWNFRKNLYIYKAHNPLILLIFINTAMLQVIFNKFI